MIRFLGSPYNFNRVGDANFANVSLLLPFNGSDGSTSFTDLSNNTLSVTAGGNAQIDDAQSKWGGSSLKLDGSGDYVSVADSVGLDFGSGDFTIEFWLRWAGLSGYQTIYDHGYTSTGGLLMQTGNGDGKFIVYAQNGSALFQESNALGTNTWGFYQLTRSGGTLTLFRDGVSKGSVSNSTTFGVAANLGIGAQLTTGLYGFNGWVQDFRISKGIARSSTVPTSAFPTS